LVFDVIGNQGLFNSWFISTVLIRLLVFIFFRVASWSFYLKKMKKNLRKKLLYLSIQFFIVFSGAIITPGLENGDLSLLHLAIKTFDSMDYRNYWCSWFINCVGSNFRHAYV